MHKLVSQLVVYRNLPADNLLEPLAAICAEFAAGDYNREELTAEIYELSLIHISEPTRRS